MVILEDDAFLDGKLTEPLPTDGATLLGGVIRHPTRWELDKEFINVKAKKIIITGGATRIGAAIAKKLSGPGVEIVVHYNKSKSNAENLKKQLSKNSTIVYLIKGDLSKESDLNSVLVLSKWNGTTTLFNPVDSTKT